MDLRVKRTTKNIKDAFFELRKKKSLDKISIKELSELAMINKATFYLHYRDIYELSDKLESEMIDGIIDEIRGINLMGERDKFEAFSKTLSNAVTKRADEIKTLFSGYENNHFINHLEDSMKKYLFSAYPKFHNNSENNILLTFLIQGSFHTYIRNTSIKPDTLIEKTTALMLKTIESYTF